MSKNILLSSTGNGGLDTLKHTGIKKTNSGLILVTNTSPTLYDSFLLCNDNYILSFDLTTSISSGYLVPGDGFTPKDELGNEVTALHITRSSSYLYVSTTEGYVRFYNPLTGNLIQVEGQYYINLGGDTEFLSLYGNEGIVITNVKNQNKLLEFEKSTPVSTLKEIYLIDDLLDGNQYDPTLSSLHKSAMLAEKKNSFSGLKGILESTKETDKPMLILDSSGNGFHITDSIYDTNTGITEYENAPDRYKFSQITKIGFSFLSADSNSFLLSDRKLNIECDFDNIARKDYLDKGVVVTNPIERYKYSYGIPTEITCAEATTRMSIAWSGMQSKAFTTAPTFSGKLCYMEGESSDIYGRNSFGWANQWRLDMNRDFLWGSVYDSTYITQKKRALKSGMWAYAIYGTGLSANYALINTATGGIISRNVPDEIGFQFAGNYDFNFLMKLQNESTYPASVSGCTFTLVEHRILVAVDLSPDNLLGFDNGYFYMIDYAKVGRDTPNGDQIILDDDYLDFALNPS